jgi:hypothetical protein
MAPRTNGQLDAAFTKAKGAWAQCAATVDMIADCQVKGLPVTAPTPATHD